MKDRASVYLLKNSANGKGYVGQHCKENPDSRWEDHLRAARSGRRHPLYDAIRKYGSTKFTAEVVWRGDPRLLDVKERFYIKKFHTFIEDRLGGGYNLTTGGDSGGRKSERTKRLLSISAKAGAAKRWARPEERANMSMRAKERMADPIVRAQISAQQKKRFEDPAQRAHAVLKQTGKKHKEETRLKMSVSQRRRYSDPDSRAAHSAMLKCRYEDPTARAVISTANRRRYADPGQRSLTGVSTKMTWSDPSIRRNRLESMRRVMDTTTYRQHLSEGSKRGWTKERRSKKSEHLKNLYRDPAELQKMKLGVKAGWTRRLENLSGCGHPWRLKDLDEKAQVLYG